MGQKIQPTGFRLPVSRNWTSRWFANYRDFAKMLNEDIKVRQYLKLRLKSAAVSKILIERPAKKCKDYYLQCAARRCYWKKGRGYRGFKNYPYLYDGGPCARKHRRSKKTGS